MRFKCGDVLISKDYPTEVAWKVISKNLDIECLRFPKYGRFKSGSKSHLESHDFHDFFKANKFFKRLYGIK